MNKRYAIVSTCALAGAMLGLILSDGVVGLLMWLLIGIGVGMLVPLSGDQLGLADYLWRLVPANPILLRVVETGGKRKRDLFIRCGYLGLLIVMTIILLVQSLGSAPSSGLGQLAQTSAMLFETMSYVQLGLVALLAPIFTAGAITQEKDSQTYDILLSTPLTNGQIVLGSLLSRLFFVIALLVSGIPIFSITQVFGGVAIRSIVMSFAIAAATAFVTGALAMAIATFKVGTRRTIFSFYLFIVIYLVGLMLLDRLPFFRPLLGYQTDNSGMPILNQPIYSSTSYLTGLHPFLALHSIFNDPEYMPPALGDLPEHLRRWPIGWWLSRPHSFYVSLMFFLSFVMVVPSIILLRRVAQSTISLKSWILQRLRLGGLNHGRKPRTVWGNPIAWREAKTKASAARATVLRYGFIVAGVAGALVLLAFYSMQEPVQSYISPRSYDPVLRRITIYGETRAVTYALAPGVSIVLKNNLAREGQPVSADSLSGYYQVIDAGINRDQITRLVLGEMPRRLSADRARQFLLGAIIVEFAVILLIVTNAAASTVTREKEDGTLDLLLTTPITSRYYIWGKLRGLVSYVLPLVAVPVLSVILFVIYDLYEWLSSGASHTRWIVFPEAVLIFPGVLIIVVAFASILGMHMSLRCRTTVLAVMSSVGIVAGAAVTLGFCGLQALDTGMGGASFIGLLFASFSPFTVMTVLVDPYQFAYRIYSDPYEAGAARTIVFVGSWVATGVYAFVVWSMYKSMVRNFDMVVRRQQR